MLKVCGDSTKKTLIIAIDSEFVSFTSTRKISGCLQVVGNRK